MKQGVFGFGRRGSRDHAATDPQWPEIIVADPKKYPGLMQDLAQRALHRLGKPHEQQYCPLCKAERSESAA